MIEKDEEKRIALVYLGKFLGRKEIEDMLRRLGVVVANPSSWKSIVSHFERFLTSADEAPSEAWEKQLFNLLNLEETGRDLNGALRGFFQFRVLVKKEIEALYSQGFSVQFVYSFGERQQRYSKGNGSCPLFEIKRKGNVGKGMDSTPSGSFKLGV